MKKLFLISLFAFISAGAIADDIPQPPMETMKHEPHEMGMMTKMSDEQKSCIENYGCKIPEMKPKDENMQKPEPGAEHGEPKRPEMTDEQKEEMDCMRKAMESCGIEMPKRPEHNDHEKPDFPRGDKPQHPDMAETK